MNTNHNPYVGPRTFMEDERDRFFGREREANELLARVLSEQEVVFYAQSGAGKSSLVNTCLIPDLRKNGFEVLLGRVGGDAPAELKVDNIFVFNLLRSLSTGDISLASLAQGSLSESLAPAADARSSRRRALVLDQFEEIFSTHHEAWEKRRAFFEQLAQLVQADARLRVILVMREDYIASLDPYVSLLPNGLQARYYMQRLEYAAALKAVKEPVKSEEFSRPYQAGVAEKLVNDLRSVKVYKPDGSESMEPGQYVEPVQLQVVCYNLWENLSERKKDGKEITEEDLQEVGDVSASLGSYYAARVKVVADAKNVRERKIRAWFTDQLISPNGVRNMVTHNPRGESGGLENEVIQALSDLVRAETRSGATFYELTHDRLVEPILESNKVWFSENLSPLQRQAALWHDQARQETWLLSDQALLDMEQWAKEHQDDLTDIEKEFLDECRTKQREKEHIQEFETQQQKLIAEQKLSRQRRIITYIAIASTIFMIFLTLIGFYQSRRANIQSEIAVAAQETAIANVYIASTAQANAIVNAQLAIANEQQSIEQAEISFSNSLSAQSNALLDENFQVSMLLGIESYRISETVQSRGALLNVAQANPRLTQILTRHSSAVSSVAFSRNGKTLASSSSDNTIILWDAKTFEPIGSLMVGQVVTNIAISPDGKTLASVSYDKSILLWDVETQKPIAESLSGHSNVVTSIAFSPDGTILASGSYDQTVILWDVKTRRSIGQPLVGHANAISSLAFSPNGQTLASGSYDNTIILWDVQTHNPIGQRLAGHSGAVISVAFSPDGESLASGSCSKLNGDNCIEGEVILWDIGTRRPIGQPLIGHTDTVTSVAFSADAKTLASGSRDKTIILWDVESRQSLDQPLAGHTDAVTSVAFNPQENTLVSGSEDNAIIVWDVEAHRSIGQPLTGHTDAVLSTAFSPDSKTLASGSWDNTIILWDVEAHRSIGKPLTGHTDAVTSVAFSADGQWLATGSLDTTVRLWNAEDLSTAPLVLTGHENSISTLSFSPDGQWLVAGSYDNTVMVWDAKNLSTEPILLQGHEASISTFAFRPNSQELATGSYDNTIRVWDMGTGQPVGQPLTGHTDTVNSVAFSPDGKTLVSSSNDQTIILWDMETGQPIGKPLTGHTGAVSSVAFSPDGKILASGSYDKTIILWDVAARQSIGQPLVGHTDVVTSLAFSPDNKTLASASYDNTIILWDVDLSSLIKKSCQRAGRNFTRAEWQRYFPAEEYRKTCDQWPLEPEVIATPVTTQIIPTIATLIPNATEIISTPGLATPTALFKVVNVTDEDRLNIRAGPGLKYEIIGKIPKDGRGIQVTGPGTEADNTIWLPIIYNGNSGWVNSFFLTIDR